LETNIDLAEIDLKNNRTLYLPKIDLFFGWGMNAGLSDAGNLVKWGDRMLWPDYQLAGITFSIPIFDGLYKAKLIQQNKLRIKQLNYQRMMLENSIEYEVQQKRNNLLSNIDLFRSQEENMKLAEEVYTHAKIKYQEGVGANLEVIEADNAYKTAQNNYYQALFDALIAEVEYEKALGIIQVPASDQ
jgi:outer membrane protein TolC